jgi:hypothetical protein
MAGLAEVVVVPCHGLHLPPSGDRVRDHRWFSQLTDTCAGHASAAPGPDEGLPTTSLSVGETAAGVASLWALPNSPILRLHGPLCRQRISLTRR